MNLAKFALVTPKQIATVKFFIKLKHVDKQPSHVRKQPSVNKTRTVFYCVQREESVETKNKKYCSGKKMWTVCVDVKSKRQGLSQFLRVLSNQIFDFNWVSRFIHSQFKFVNSRIEKKVNPVKRQNAEKNYPNPHRTATTYIEPKRFEFRNIHSRQKAQANYKPGNYVDVSPIFQGTIGDD